MQAGDHYIEVLWRHVLLAPLHLECQGIRFECKFPKVVASKSSLYWSSATCESNSEL